MEATEAIEVNETAGQNETLAQAGNTQSFQQFFVPTVLYAALCTFCLYGTLSSVTMPLCAAATVLHCVRCMKAAGVRVRRGTWLCFAVMLLLGVSDCLTDNTFILFWNNAALILVLFVAVLHAHCDDERWRLGTYFAALFRLVGGSLAHLGDFFADTKCYLKQKGCKGKTAVNVLCGVAVALPILAVVTALLCSADRAFASQLGGLVSGLNVRTPALVALLFAFVFFCAWSARDFLKAVRFPEPQQKKQHSAVIAVSMLVPFNALYAYFVATQFLAPPEGTLAYASRAREGFFQLLAVCAINVLIVQVTRPRFEKSRVLTAMLALFCACTYGMLFSAARRMLGYIAWYDAITFPRVLVLWTLGVLALLLAGQVAQVFWSRFPLFRYGFAVVCACYLALSFSRADWWIARYNLARMDLTSQSVVAWDLRQLAWETSCDAAPVFAEYGVLHLEGDNASFDYWMNQKTLPSRSLRRWNFSRERARALSAQQPAVEP